MLNGLAKKPPMRSPLDNTDILAPTSFRAVSSQVANLNRGPVRVLIPAKQNIQPDTLQSIMSEAMLNHIFRVFGSEKRALKASNKRNSLRGNPRTQA